jgi:hypothetical protein
VESKFNNVWIALKNILLMMKMQHQNQLKKKKLLIWNYLKKNKNYFKRKKNKLKRGEVRKYNKD